MEKASFFFLYAIKINLKIGFIFFIFYFLLCLPSRLVKFKSYLRSINLHFVCFGIFIGEENKSKKISYLMMFDCDDEYNSKYIYNSH